MTCLTFFSSIYQIVNITKDLERIFNTVFSPISFKRTNQYLEIYLPRKGFGVLSILTCLPRLPDKHRSHFCEYNWLHFMLDS